MSFQRALVPTTSTPLNSTPRQEAVIELAIEPEVI